MQIESVTGKRWVSPNQIDILVESSKLLMEDLAGILFHSDGDGFVFLNDQGERGKRQFQDTLLVGRSGTTYTARLATMRIKSSGDPVGMTGYWLHSIT